MSETQAIQQLQERVEVLEMQVRALSIKEVKPTKADLMAIRRADKDIAHGRVTSWEKVKQRHG